MHLEPPNYYNPKCMVCENDGHGIHFGAQTCRACAMFFRRSKSQKVKFQCKKRSLFCDLSSAENRLMCKFCRFEKCKKVGMDGGRKSEINALMKMDQKEKMGQMERVEYDIRHPITGKKVRWIDIEPIIRRSREILENFHPSDPGSLNPLQTMTSSFEKLRSGQKFNPKFERFMIFDDFFTNFEEFMTRCAEWLMHSEEFRNLPNHEKVAFFKIVWAVWRRMERFTMSAKVFGRQCLEEKILLISDDQATRLDDFVLDVSDICEQGFEQFRCMTKKHVMNHFECVAKPCIEWNLTSVEINFAICQTVWIYASRKLLGQTLQASDRFLAEISENLHDYYKNEMRIGNYAGRLAVLMDMVNNVLKTQSSHEKMMDMAFLFDVVSVVVSDPKFFSV